MEKLDNWFWWIFIILVIIFILVDSYMWQTIAFRQQRQIAILQKQLNEALDHNQYSKR